MDPTWTEEDIARALTFTNRMIRLGVSPKEHAKLVPVAVWKAKFPGLVYPSEIEDRLKTLMFE